MSSWSLARNFRLLCYNLDRVGGEVFGKKKWVRYVGKIRINLANPSYGKGENWPGNESMGVGSKNGRWTGEWRAL